MQESAHRAVADRALQVALNWKMKIHNQLPTGIRDVLEVLKTPNTWKKEGLKVIRSFLFSLKYDLSEEEWVLGSRRAEQDWLMDNDNGRIRTSSFRQQMGVEKPI